MNRRYLIGVDIGTTTSKGVMITTGGEKIAVCAIEHGVDRPQPGWAEHDAEEVWWGDFIHICRTLLEQSSVDPRQILAVGCSTLSAALLPVDRAGHPLRSGILYAIDTRAFDEIEILKKSLGDEYSIHASANGFSSQIILPKILWLKRHEPDVFQNTARFLNASSYIVSMLTGNCVIDHGNAAAGGLPYNINSMEWDSIACQEVGIKPEQLPELSWGYEIAGHVTKPAAEATGLFQGTPVATGTADRMAEILSVGALRKGFAVIGYGTTFCFDVCTGELARYPGLMIARTCIPDSFLAGGGMASGGELTKWFRDNFGQVETELERNTGTNAYQSLSNIAGRIGAGSEGLILLPYFNGERCPIFDSRARGMLFGLAFRHRREHIYRAILEGVAYGIRHIIDTLRAAEIPVEQVAMVGGGTLSSVWTQIISDVTQLEQRSSKHPRGAHYGAAYLAGLGVGEIGYSFINGQWDDYGTIVRPDPENIEIYDKYYRIYRSLYDKTAEEMHLLSE